MWWPDLNSEDDTEMSRLGKTIGGSLFIAIAASALAYVTASDRFSLVQQEAVVAAVVAAVVGFILAWVTRIGAVAMCAILALSWII